jgi:hypothetical protein
VTAARPADPSAALESMKSKLQALQIRKQRILNQHSFAVLSELQLHAQSANERLLLMKLTEAAKILEEQEEVCFKLLTVKSLNSCWHVVPSATLPVLLLGLSKQFTPPSACSLLMIIELQIMFLGCICSICKNGHLYHHRQLNRKLHLWCCRHWQLLWQLWQHQKPDAVSTAGSRSPARLCKSCGSTRSLMSAGCTAGF